MFYKLNSFRDLSKNTNKLPVLLIGSIEQHGPFLPVGTDSLVAEALGDSLEEKLSSKLLILPVLTFGCSKEHLGFPGTISIEFSTYMLFIKDILNSLKESGFKKVLIISSHGGNDLVAKLIQADWNYESKMKVEYIYAFDEEVDKKTTQLFGESEMHAGSSESSIVAFLHPNLVKFIGKKINKLFAPNLEKAFVLYNSKEVTPLGILNFSPELEINPDKGQKLYDFIVQNICQKVTNILKN